MVKYLEVDEDLKNGYKLADILSTTCYVDGDEMIHEEFCRKIALTMKQNQSNLSNVQQQLAEDLKNFDLIQNFQLLLVAPNANIKRIIYRSITLFIPALGRLHDVDKNSYFDIIDEFQRRHEISDVTAHKMSHAVAVACHIRIFRYMFKNRQDDVVDQKLDLFAIKKTLKELTQIVNKRCLVKCLATAYV